MHASLPPVLRYGKDSEGHRQKEWALHDLPLLLGPLRLGGRRLGLTGHAVPR